MSRIPFSPSRTAIAGALVLLAMALPAAAYFQSADPVPADTGTMESQIMPDDDDPEIGHVEMEDDEDAGQDDDLEEA